MYAKYKSLVTAKTEDKKGGVNQRRKHKRWRFFILKITAVITIFSKLWISREFFLCLSVSNNKDFTWSLFIFCFLGKQTYEMRVMPSMCTWFALYLTSWSGIMAAPREFWFRHASFVSGPCIVSALKCWNSYKSFFYSAPTSQVLVHFLLQGTHKQE